MKVGSKIQVNKEIRRFGGSKGSVIKVNLGEIGVKLTGHSAPVLWFVKDELTQL